VTLLRACPRARPAVRSTTASPGPGCDTRPTAATAGRSPRRGRKSTRPGANGVVELSPFDFLDRLADLVPPPRKHRHRYHGVFAPNHKLRSAVTALVIANVGKRCDAATDGHAVGGHAAGGDAPGDCCGSCDKPPSRDTSRIAWAKLMARVGEEFPFAYPGCGGDIRLIAFITEPGPIRKVLTHLGEPLEPPPVARRPTGQSSCRSTTTATSFNRRLTSCPTSTSTASDGIPCHGADGPQEERFQDQSAPTRKTRP
jgi:hypothetical protein